MHRITAIAYTLVGLSTILFWFIIIHYFRFWKPSRLTLGAIVICIAMINISGLVYLIRKRADCGRWLLVTGLLGNGISLLIIAYAAAGLIFLEYFFRM